MWKWMKDLVPLSVVEVFSLVQQVKSVKSVEVCLLMTGMC
ncbi:MAG: hypothetical protein [Phormidium phage MIS-PhV1A]|jgi:hypothetical protein|nr:MAG: hypothetical protein AV945_gp55 [Phormidium phage MIS-PhV1A]AGZ61800.1 MAG: hypothetical protein [Phormidium phage MIS-PhV1A]